MVEKNTWVTIRRVVLEPGQRAAGIPEDTAQTPLMLWVKGWLTEDAELGGEAAVLTKTGRIERGTLEDVMPAYELGYGDFVPELARIGAQARALLSGGERVE